MFIDSNILWIWKKRDLDKQERQGTKAKLLREGIIFLVHLFARSILLMKMLKIIKTKAN